MDSSSISSDCQIKRLRTSSKKQSKMNGSSSNAGTSKSEILLITLDSDTEDDDIIEIPVLRKELQISGKIPQSGMCDSQKMLVGLIRDQSKSRMNTVSSGNHSGDITSTTEVFDDRSQAIKAVEVERGTHSQHDQAGEEPQTSQGFVVRRNMTEEEITETLNSPLGFFDLLSKMQTPRKESKTKGNAQVISGNNSKITEHQGEALKVTDNDGKEVELTPEEQEQVEEFLRLSEDAIPGLSGRILPLAPLNKGYSRSLTDQEETGSQRVAPVGPSAVDTLYLNFMVNDRLLRVLVDTGSAVSQVPAALCQAYGWKIYECHPDQVMIKLMSVFGEVRPMDPKFTWIHIKLNGVSYRHCVWVVPTEQADHALIGMDFLFGKPLVFSFQHGIMMSAPIEYVSDESRVSDFRGAVYAEYWKLRKELAKLEEHMADIEGKSVQCYKQKLLVQGASTEVAEMMHEDTPIQTYISTVKQRASQVFLQLLVDDIDKVECNVALPPQYTPEELTGNPAPTLRIPGIRKSWESMCDRALKLEELEEYYEDCRRTGRVMTEWDKMCCRAIEEECRPPRRFEVPPPVPTYSAMGSRVADVHLDELYNARFVQEADEIIQDARNTRTVVEPPLSVRSQTIPLVSLSLVHSTTLQPRTAHSCMVRGDILINGAYVCVPNKQELGEALVVMQHCLAECKGGELLTVLVNMSDEEVILDKGTNVAFIADDVEDIQEAPANLAPRKEGTMKSCSNSRNLSTSNKWKDLVKITNPKVTPEILENFLIHLEEVDEVLPTPDRPIGRYTGTAHHIITGDHPPITCKPHRIPPHKREAMKEACAEMQRLGVAAPTSSPWAFPCLLVKKKDGGWRIVADFRKLNDITEKFYFPLPNIDDSLHYIQDALWFTSIDLANAFWQIPMSPESCKKAAFCTPDGNFQYNVMAMGLCNSSSTFQAVMNETLSDEQMVTCLTFLDDCLVYAKTFEELVERTIRILSKFAKVGLTIKPEKCTWLVNEINFLGHHLSDGKIEPDAQQVWAIMDFPVPKNTKDLRSFVGKCGYYSQFIYGYAMVCLPFYELFKIDKNTKKEVAFRWNEEREGSFQQLKVALSTKPCLTMYNPKLPTQLRTDACDYGIAAILVQKHEDGWHPVAFYSKKLNISQIRIYNVSEKELFAIIVAIQKFHQYLNQTIHVVTDHRALQYLKNFKDPKGRLARWILFLSQYEIICTHRKGTMMGDADCLSRYPVEDAMGEEDESIVFPRFAQTICTDVTQCDARMAAAAINVLTKGRVYTIVYGQPSEHTPIGNYRAFKKSLPEAEGDSAKAVLSTEESVSGGTASSSYDSTDEESEALLSQSDKTKWNRKSPCSEHESEHSKIMHDVTYIRPVNENWLVEEQAKDEFCADVIRLLGQPDNLVLTRTQQNSIKQFTWMDGTLFKIRRKRDKILRFLVVPKSMRITVVREFHDGLAGGGHSGFHNTYSKIASRFWFPQMKSYIQNYVFSCETCQKNNINNKPRNGFLKPIIPKRLFETWGIDILGPLPGSRQGFKYVIVATEYMSRWAVAKAVHEVSRHEVCDFMLECICTIFGFPKKLITDQGSQFMSETFEDLLTIFGISHLATTAFSPWQNGLTEVFNKDLCLKISKYCNEQQDDWDLYVPIASWWHNTVPNTTTGFSPFKVLFGQEPRVPMDHVFDTPLPEAPEKVDAYIAARQRQMAEMHDLIFMNMENRAERATNRFDDGRVATEFEVGEFVWLQDHSILKGKVRKLTGKRTGPWKVERIVSPSQIKIIRGKGRKRDHKVVNPIYLDKYVSRSEEIVEDLRIDNDRRVRYADRLLRLIKPVQKPSTGKVDQPMLDVLTPTNVGEDELESIFSDDSRVAPPPVPTVQQRAPGKRRIVPPKRYEQYVQSWLASAKRVQLSSFPIQDISLCEYQLLTEF